jgi:hypothetical protein
VITKSHHEGTKNTLSSVVSCTTANKEGSLAADRNNAACVICLSHESCRGIHGQSTLTTTTDTCSIHGEWTDLRDDVAYLRKLADEIETELRSEQRGTHNPSR